MTLASKDIENERALFSGCPAGHLTDLTYPEVDRGERLQPLPCCQLGLGRQRQQCGLAAANRAAASWRANRLNERRSTKVEWNVQCRLTGEHFEKIIVGNGHHASFEVNRFTASEPTTGTPIKIEVLTADCRGDPHPTRSGFTAFRLGGRQQANCRSRGLRSACSKTPVGTVIVQELLCAKRQ